jgi:hypothetical protein
MTAVVDTSLCLPRLNQGLDGIGTLLDVSNSLLYGLRDSCAGATNVHAAAELVVERFHSLPAESRMFFLGRVGYIA